MDDDSGSMGDLGSLDDGPGTDVATYGGGELEHVVEAELVDDEPELMAEPEVIDAEVLPDDSAGRQVEPWAVTDNPADWDDNGQNKAPEQRQGEHDGNRAGGGPSGGRGGGAFSGGRKSWNPFRRRGGSGSGGGSGGSHFSLVGGVHVGNGAALVKTGSLASNNSATAGAVVGAGGRRPRAGRRR